MPFINGTRYTPPTVTPPVSSTDNAVVRFDGTAGNVIQNSVVTVSDTGELVTAGGLQVG